MGKGKRSCFTSSLFGFNQQMAGDARRPEEAVVAVERPQQRYYQGTRVRPRHDEDDGNYYGPYGYADRDIDKKAAEFIERVHRGVNTNGQDG